MSQQQVALSLFSFRVFQDECWGHQVRSALEIVAMFVTTKNPTMKTVL